jgi:hypothetical protein
MELETVPPVPPSEQEALREALARAGVDLDGGPGGYRCAWRRAGLAEATGYADESDGYTPSPRSTRGATRA